MKEQPEIQIGEKNLGDIRGFPLTAMFLQLQKLLKGCENIDDDRESASLEAEYNVLLSDIKTNRGQEPQQVIPRHAPPLPERSKHIA